MNPLTFDDICRIEPEIARLYQSAKENNLGTSPQYLWDNFYQVTVEHLVGPVSKKSQLQDPDVHKIVIEKFIEVLGLRHS